MYYFITLAFTGDDIKLKFSWLNNMKYLFLHSNQQLSQLILLWSRNKEKNKINRDIESIVQCMLVLLSWVFKEQKGSTNHPYTMNMSLKTQYTYPSRVIVDISLFKWDHNQDS